MIYLMLTIWLVLAVLLGRGVYQLLVGLLKPAWVNAALLPGTAVSELAYIAGCLISGGEVRKARLIGGGGKGSQPASQASGSGKLGWISPLAAAVVSMLACGAGIVLVHGLLGGPVIGQFILGGEGLGWASPAGWAALADRPPTSWGGLWVILHQQVDLVRRFSETLGRLGWLDWRVPLFVYLALCLSVRLGPAGRPLRPTLLAAAILSALIAAAGLISSRFDHLVRDVWPLVTYVWASLLWLLAVLAVVKGVVALVGAVKR